MGGIQLSFDEPSHDAIVALAGMFVKESLKGDFNKCKDLFRYLPEHSLMDFNIHVMVTLAEFGFCMKNEGLDDMCEQMFNQIQKQEINAVEEFR